MATAVDRKFTDSCSVPPFCQVKRSIVDLFVRFFPCARRYFRVITSKKKIDYVTEDARVVSTVIYDHRTAVHRLLDRTSTSLATTPRHVVDCTGDITETGKGKTSALHRGGTNGGNDSSAASLIGDTEVSGSANRDGVGVSSNGSDSRTKSTPAKNIHKLRRCKEESLVELVCVEQVVLNGDIHFELFHRADVGADQVRALALSENLAIGESFF